MNKPLSTMTIPAQIKAIWPEMKIFNPRPLPRFYWGVSAIYQNLVDRQLVVRVFDRDGESWNVPVAFLVESEENHIALPEGNWAWDPFAKLGVLKGKIVPTGNFGAGAAEWNGGAGHIMLLTPEIESCLIEGVYMKGSPLPHTLPIFEVSLYVNGEKAPSLAEQLMDLRQEVKIIKSQIKKLEGR